MSYFATFSHVDNDQRTAVRLADDGRATLLITGRHGEIKHSADGRIDALDAADIVADAMLLSPDLPDTGGEYSIGIGDGEGAPELRTFSRAQMPAAAYDLELRMRRVVDHLSHDLPRYRDSAPERTVGMSAGDFMMWTGSNFLGHVAHADAWKPAMAAVVLPSIIGMLARSGFGSIGLGFVYPLVARAGARSGR